jgi:ATP-dependent Clp protease ATP-binding subunit ClpA
MEMFERFTDRARRVVVLAQEEARMLNHNYIGTEHLLLGLIHEGEGVAAKALESLGISLEAVRQQVGEIIGHGTESESGHIPFTPRAKKVLELSLRESTMLGHNYIGTEHILLGLVREGEGVAAQVLVNLGADLNRVRQAVVKLLQGYQSAGRGRRGRVGPEDVSGAPGSIEWRLRAIELRLGIEPGELPHELREIDKQVAAVRREKEAAVDDQNFEKAAALREKEKQLLRRHAEKEMELRSAARDRESAGGGSGTGASGTGGSGTGGNGTDGSGTDGSGTGATADVAAGQAAGEAPGEAAEETESLRAEVMRLQALLRKHGIEPDDSAA